MEISQLLDGPKISGHGVCEAFTLASTVILSCEDFSVGCLAGTLIFANYFLVLINFIVC